MMSDAVIVAIISLVGSAIGTFSGVISTQKLIKYRLDRLEEKVDSISSTKEKVQEIEIKQKVADNRIGDIEKRLAA